MIYSIYYGYLYQKENCRYGERRQVWSGNLSYVYALYTDERQL